MKRGLILMILAAVLLSGCTASAGGLKEPVTFYYLLEQYTYGQDAQVFAPEQWEAAGHRQDLTYLLSLYLMGPSQEGHLSPLPRDTKVYSTKELDRDVFVNISDTGATLSDTAFTRACACLALTCFDLTDAQSVTVRSGMRSITMTRDTLILVDDSPMTTEETA
ncbi:MAG: hypothetical protein Q4F17_04325 [Eubacteriales bacterium]|nr:hypothetical protein [Eubacteriales bacterium]